MKYGIIQNCTDEQIFEMLYQGKLVDILCPKCKTKGDYSPQQEEIECPKCKELFISPLLNPELVNKEDI